MNPGVLAQGAPLGERILVAAVGPLVTILVGGLLVWWITSEVQRRRETADKKQEQIRDDLLRNREELRADQNRAQDLARADDALRQELITAMTESAGTLYLSGQHYWRVKASGQADQSARAALDAQYLKSRAVGEVLENRLEGYFASEAPRQRWHQVMDLLTVRYFQLLDADTDAVYRENAGDQHAGLTADDLRTPKLVLNTYRQALKSSVRAVLDTDLRKRS